MQNAVNHIAAACAAADVRHAVICPGSRNAPLVMAFARHPEIICHSVVDERSAGFIALGMAQRIGWPIALICTSGSAVVNFYPAVVEAFYQRLPLLVITADRPPELIDQWDGQAIRQSDIFGRHVKASYNLPDKYDGPEEFSRITIEAFMHAFTGIQGPVHINVPLREPLYTAIDEKFVYPAVAPVKTALLNQTDEQLPDLSALQNAINQNRKVLVVIGEHRNCNINLCGAYEKAAGKIPFVAELLSNQLFKYRDVDCADMILSISNQKLKEELQPDILLTFGTSILSKNLKLFLRQYKPKHHFHISRYGETADPFGTNPVQLVGPPRQVFENLDFSGLGTEYTVLWRNLNEQVVVITDSFLSSTPFFEMTAVDKVLKQLPEKSFLQLANSMPVRWVNILGIKQHLFGSVNANRGVSGIDGCTSTAVGVAYMDDFIMQEHNHTGKSETNTVTLITGDVAFFYDSNALWNKFAPANLRIVVLNNGGGGIFRLIDGPGQMPELEEFVETRHTRTAKLLAQDYGVEYASAQNFEELDMALKDFYKSSDRPKILEIITDSKITAEFFKEYKKRINELEI